MTVIETGSESVTKLAVGSPQAPSGVHTPDASTPEAGRRRPECRDGMECQHHASDPVGKMECLARAGLRVEREPRLLMVSHDNVALALGAAPIEATTAPPGAVIWWLPAVDVPGVAPLPVR